MTDEKYERNTRVSTRYEQLMHEGKHGHYETMFHIVREEVERERERCAMECELFRSGLDNRSMQAEGWAAAECAEIIRKRSNVK